MDIENAAKTIAQESGFTKAHATPPFLCPTAFKCITDLEIFKSWTSGGNEWQFRISGSPGTGKVHTILASNFGLAKFFSDNVSRQLYPRWLYNSWNEFMDQVYP